MKIVEVAYGNRNEILKFPDHYLAMAVVISDVGIVANAEGKKIVPKGTIMGGGFIEDDTIKAVKTNGAGAEGVLVNDCDVTYGPREDAVYLHGFINIAKLPEAPVVGAKTALTMIKFVK